MAFLMKGIITVERKMLLRKRKMWYDGWYGHGKKDLERGRITEEYMTLRRKTLHWKRKIWLSDITPLIVVKPYKDEGGGDKKNKQRVIKSYQGIFDILHNIHLFSAGNIQVCPLISLRAVHAYHRPSQYY